MSWHHARVSSTNDAGPQAADGRRSPRRVTQADVAKAAGVSPTTVSFVLNDSPRQSIPEATRRRVLEAAAQLDYAPSPAARALAAGHTNLVLGLVPDWPIGLNMGLLLKRLTVAFATRGLTFLTHTATGDDPDFTSLWRTVSPAAVLAFGDVDESQVGPMRAAGIPVTVALWSRSRRRAGEVDLWDQRVGRLQAEHLLTRGHHRLGYAWPGEDGHEVFATPRLAGVKAACADAGVPAPTILPVPLGADEAVEAVLRWRNSDPPVTAVAAYNDEVALALLAGLRRLGLTAPDDLAVVGVDDIPVAALSDPPLTTVTYDANAIAEHLARTVLSALDGASGPRRRAAQDIQLVVRSST